jgi:hypothetical protein
MKRILLSCTLFVLSLSACTAEVSVESKLETAEEYLSEHGGEPGFRAAAYDLYLDVLSDGNKEQKVRAHFGVGMIGFLDLVQGLPRLLETDDSEGESESDMPPADAMARAVDTLIHQSIDRGIVKHFAVVRESEDFSFVFKNLAFPVTDSSETPINLSGEWDLTEIGAIYGALQIVVGLEEFLYSYDFLIETVLEAVLSGKPIPELPSSPAEFPAWLVQAAKDLGLDPLPWLRPEFGVLNPNADLAAMQARLDDGFGALLGAIEYLDKESDNQNDDVFPKSKFVRSLLEKLLPDAGVATIAGNVVTNDLLIQLFGALQTSAQGKGAFMIPEDVYELLELVVDKSIPLNPVDLRIPAINLASLFTNPIKDLKDVETGLLPYYDSKGEFVVESEQEPGNEDDFEDVGVDGFVDADLDGVADFAGRPGAGNDTWDYPLGFTSGTVPDLRHKSPLGTVELGNGIVDPVYLFFGNASMNGLLLPAKETSPGSEEYEPDTGTDYTNADLMRLVSALVWIVDGIDL